MLHASTTHGNKGTYLFFLHSLYEKSVFARMGACVEEFTYVESGSGVILNPDPVQTLVFITNLPLKINNKYLFLFRRRS
jgi:hypothetical protein